MIIIKIPFIFIHSCDHINDSLNPLYKIENNGECEWQQASVCYHPMLFDSGITKIPFSSIFDRDSCSKFNKIPSLFNNVLFENQNKTIISIPTFDTIKSYWKLKSNRFYKINKNRFKKPIEKSLQALTQEEMKESNGEIILNFTNTKILLIKQN